MEIVYVVIWKNGNSFIYRDHETAIKNMLPGDQIFKIKLNLDLISHN